MPIPSKRVMPDPNEPGVQDATVSDFLLPYLMGQIPAVKAMMPMAGTAGKLAPAAEDVAGSEMRDAMMRSMSRPAMSEGGVVEEEMPHLAGGTPSLDDPFSVNTGDSSTVKAMPLNPAAVPPQAPPPAAPAQMPPIAPSPVASAPARPMPGMPPSVTPDELKGYLDKQRGAIQKYNPDTQYAREQEIMSARKSPLAILAHAAGTFAGPEYAKAQDERWDNELNQSAGSFANARKGTMENMESEQKVDSNDPSSPLSRMAQKAYGSQLTSAGLPASAVPFMSASLIGDVATKQVTLAEALARINEEASYHKGMLKNTESQGKREESKNRVDAAKDLLSKSGNAKILGIPIPFTSDVSGADKDKALGVIRNEMEPSSTTPAGAEAPEASSATAHPKANEALNWAMQNPHDPKSAEILKRLGKK